jgi:hypothetical protein
MTKIKGIDCWTGDVRYAAVNYNNPAGRAELCTTEKYGTVQYIYGTVTTTSIRPAFSQAVTTVEIWNLTTTDTIWANVNTTAAANQCVPVAANSNNTPYCINKLTSLGTNSVRIVAGTATGCSYVMAGYY